MHQKMVEHHVGAFRYLRLRGIRLALKVLRYSGCYCVCMRTIIVDSNFDLYRNPDQQTSSLCAHEATTVVDMFDLKNHKFSLLTSDERQSRESGGMETLELL